MKYQDVLQLILPQSQVPNSLLPNECLQLDIQGVPWHDDPHQNLHHQPHLADVPVTQFSDEVELDWSHTCRWGLTQFLAL